MVGEGVCVCVCVCLEEVVNWRTGPKTCNRANEMAINWMFVSTQNSYVEALVANVMYLEMGPLGGNSG